MIHSMSGGVLADDGFFRFAKVKVGESSRWYLSPMGIKEGCRVLVPFEGEEREGIVERVELCTRKTAPIPPKRAEFLRLL